MTPLGKHLVFYLKYAAEMNRLYGDPDYCDGEEPDLTGLNDAERVQEMARIVGAAAHEQAADFIKACAAKIESHLHSLQGVNISSQATRTKIMRNWTWYGECAVSAHNCKFRCGVSILKRRGDAVSGYDARLRPRSSAVSRPGTVVPWLWRRGGTRWEDRVQQTMELAGHLRSGGRLMFGGGSIALATGILLLPENHLALDVDRDPLVDQVAQAFTRLQPPDVAGI